MTRTEVSFTLYPAGLKKRNCSRMAAIGFTPLEKTIPFYQKLLSSKADNCQKTPSARTTRVWRSLTGFTLVELIVVLIIVSILAATSIPLFEKAVDEAHKKGAESLLNVIRNAEQIYQTDRNQYYGFFVLNDATRRALNFNVYNDEEWQYKVSASGFGAAAAATATAVRQRGRHKDELITMNIKDGSLISVYVW